MLSPSKPCSCGSGKKFKNCCFHLSAQSPAPIATINWIWFFSIFLIAFIPRLSLLVEARHWILTEKPILDAAYYLEWAYRILSGGWKGEAGVYPASPGYPYLLAVLLGILGNNLTALYFTQCVISSLSCVLVFCLANRFFSRTASAAAALILSVYGASVLYANVLLKATWIEFFNLALMLSVVRGMERGGALEWVLPGILIGVSAHFRPNILMYFPLLLSYLSIRRGTASRIKIAQVTMLGLGISVVIFPVAIRNKMIGGEWAISTAHGGMNFYTGNHGRSAAPYRPLPFARSETQFEIKDFHSEAERRAGKPLTSAEASKFWYGETFRNIRSDPRGWLILLVKKFCLIWNNYEQPINLNLYFYAEIFRVLSLLSKVGFWLIAPLGIMGMLISLKERALIPLHLYLVAQVSSLIGFFVVSEYRHPLAAVLVVYSAGSFDWFRDRLIEGAHARKKVVGAGLLLGLASLITTIPGREVLGSRMDLAVAYYNLGIVCVNMDRWADAVNAFNASLHLLPGDLDALYSLAEISIRRNQPAEAKNYLVAAMRAHPNSFPARHRILLAHAYLALGELGKAQSELEKAIELDPSNGDAIYNLILVLRKSGQNASAAAHLDKLLMFQPPHRSALLLAAQIAFTENKRARGYGYLARLQLMSPNDPEINDTLGVALATDGHYFEAKKAFERAVADSSDYEPARKNLERINYLIHSSGKTKPAFNR
jgi:tetratricopeptide (TPR) repeat protein